MGIETGGNRSFNPLDIMGRLVAGKMNEMRLPTEEGLGFQSTVGIYGARVVRDKQARLVYDMTGGLSRLNAFGDCRLRVYDEHIGISNPLRVRQTHPGAFWEHYSIVYQVIHPGPKRYRGTPEEILLNVRRLGLEEFYGGHPRGIEIRKPEIYTNGFALQDIWRADRIESSLLGRINRFQAVEAAARHLHKIHDTFGAVGEVLPSDIIFRHLDGSVVKDPVLNLPDIVFNPNKSFGRVEQKVIDLLDFMISIGFEELHRTADPQNVSEALERIVRGYGRDNVIRWTGIFAGFRRKRLTLDHPFFTRIHNVARLGGGIGLNLKWGNLLRQAIVEACR